MKKMNIPQNPKVAIVGATGAVGKEFMQLILERGFSFSELFMVASQRSKGKEISFRGKRYRVEALDEFDFAKVDVAVFSAGTETSKVWAPVAAAAGALVIDNTNAFRMDMASPLVVPQVNGDLLKQRPESGIIANPNCSTIQMVRALSPLKKHYGINQVVVSTYQAASGGGLSGIEELKKDSAQHLVSPSKDPIQKKFPRGLGFNVVPQIDVFLDSGFTLEEQKMVQESQKIFSEPHFNLTATAVRVPVINGHSEAIYVETEKEMELEQVYSLLKNEEELIAYTEQDCFPTPRFIKEQNHVHVGRIRQNPQNKKGIWFWVVANNLRIGAALNALQILEKCVVLSQQEVEYENFSA